ncbi:uncharacterized protein LOC134444043 [Engraulis encrasicolus]|uniref:uncharacterized protein LOC134444043 n=1 Tax=Engraulis encrasicolus TaxID=184585 RepID=UPI002FCF6E5B
MLVALLCCRKFVLQLASEAHDDAHSTLGFLQELHERTTDELIHTAARNLEVCLQVYFRREGVCLGEELSKDTKVLFSYLAREPDIHPFCLKGVYTQVVSLYLKHLLLSNQSQLERRWGQVGTVIRADAEVIHKLFTQQSEGVVNRSVLLLKVATVLSVTDEETFNSTCRELQQDTHISKEQVNQLILWKDRLSRQQVKNLLDTAPQSLWKRLPSLWTRTSQSAASIV